MPTDVRYPRILDRVIVWDGVRGTIVARRAGYATIDADDDLRVTAPEDKLRWDPLGRVWLIVTEPEDEPIVPESSALGGADPSERDFLAVGDDDRAERVAAYWDRVRGL